MILMGKTTDPGKQRKRQANRDLHQKKRNLQAHLAEDLLIRYDRRSLTVREDDTVEIMRGSYAGEEGTVMEVDTDRGMVAVEGVVIEKADGTKTPKWIDPSNVRIIDLDLSDRRRRDRLGRVAEEAWEEQRREEE